MMKKRAVSVMVLAMAAGLTGCFSTTRLVQKTQILPPEAYKTATVQELQTLVSGRDAALKTLNAQVLITATTGGAKEGKVTEYTSFSGYIFVQKPAYLRVIMKLPVLGSRALDMVSDGQTFTLVHATAGHGDVWIQGSNTVTAPSQNGLENLRPPVFLDSLLVPGVKDGEFVTLTESTRVIAAETRHHDAVEEPDYDLTVLKPMSGNVMRRERTIHINRETLLPFEQDLYDDAGRVVTVALYENYQPVALGGGKTQAMPMLVTIKRPLDEYSLKIEVTKLTLNEEFDADQFELKVPAGAVVKKMP
jgi:outer membrane lipoprotein-sorting protein